MNNILVDSCFWYALFDVRDKDHHNAVDLSELLGIGTIIVPYPILYETVNTRFARNKSHVIEFEKILNSTNTQIIDDKDYKETAVNLTIESILKLNRPLSLVDMILRLMIDDINMKIDYLFTFNKGDFIDLCLKNKVELIG